MSQNIRLNISGTTPIPVPAGYRAVRFGEPAVNRYSGARDVYVGWSDRFRKWKAEPVTHQITDTMTVLPVIGKSRLIIERIPVAPPAPPSCGGRTDIRVDVRVG